MGTFKELNVWKESIKLAANIYRITKQQPFSKDYGLSNQIQRASVSISSNISEGEERGTIKENIYFLNVAKGSAAEVISQLHVAFEIGYINKITLDHLENQAEKIKAMLKNLIKSEQ